ncbi:hypothetical protein [Actinotalea solisilvae]|uniref:hypothetical protein n=1 Tax=Actinotalea solisilvae TaxID=2072922 RepID=UPI0018F2395D|nr:hypothetical protein [Actinotalea solisilvae]
MAVTEGQYSIDPGAVAELVEAFWGPNGWRVGAGGLTALPRKALDAGLLFAGPRRLDHDGWIAAAHALRDRVRLEDVSNAFVASLGAGRRDLRSAISSWFLLAQLPEHAPDPWDGGCTCGICGLPLTDEEIDLNVMSFERFQWGGVRHDEVQYATFDLEMFLRAPRADLDSRAVELGRSLIQRLRSAPANATVTSLSRSAGLPESNAARRESLLAVLGVCGVLAAPDHPGFATTFVPFRDRQDRPTGRSDVPYPACWWRGEFGIDETVAARLLPLIAG